MLLWIPFLLQKISRIFLLLCFHSTQWNVSIAQKYHILFVICVIWNTINILSSSQRSFRAITKSLPNVISAKSTFKSFTMLETPIHIDINLWIDTESCVQGLSILDNPAKLPKMLAGNNSIFIEYCCRILLWDIFHKIHHYPSFSFRRLRQFNIGLYRSQNKRFIHLFWIQNKPNMWMHVNLGFGEIPKWSGPLN